MRKKGLPVWTVAAACAAAAVCAVCVTVSIHGKDYSLTRAVFGAGQDGVTVGTMSVSEYGIASQREITSLCDSAQGLMTGSKYVLSGSETYSAELADAETAAAEADTVADSIGRYAEPQTKTQEKAATLAAVGEYRSAVLSYEQALKKEDPDAVASAVKKISASVADMTASCGSPWQE